MGQPFVPRSRTEPVDGRLAECEAIIERGLANFIEVGAALADIRDGRLYRASHTTFQAYLRERWNLGRHRAYQLIDAAEAAGDVAELHRDRIANPYAAEALADVPVEDRARVVEIAADDVGDKPIRAADVRKAAAKIRELTDDCGNVIPEHLRESFESIEDIKAIVSELRRLERSVAEHATSRRGWEAVFVKALRNDLANARRHLEDGRAFAICPLCHGGRGCRQCSDRGWMTRRVYEAQPEEHHWTSQAITP